MYFFRPLSATEVFPKLENANKIVLISKFDDIKDNEALNIEIKDKELEYFINLLQATKYRRTLGKTNVQSQAKAYDILLVHNSNNYIIVINNRGYVVVDVMGNKKKFKILSSKKDTLLKLINQMQERK